MTFDLKSVLKDLRSGGGGGGGGGGGQKREGPQMTFWKKPKGIKSTTMFRLYRFVHNGDKQYCATRLVHNTGTPQSPNWLPCTGEGCTVCKSWQELRKMALLDDINRKAAFEKADQIRPQRKFEFVAVNSADPTGFLSVELPDGASKKIFLACAKEAGFVGGYPERAAPDASADTKAANELLFAEFDEKTKQGLEALCGPSGRDIAITVNPNAVPKSEYYTVDITRGTQKTLPFPEDDTVPNPYVVRERIEAARARRG